MNTNLGNIVNTQGEELKEASKRIIVLQGDLSKALERATTKKLKKTETDVNV